MSGSERRICEEFTSGYYGLCAIGGMLSAGTTHLAITPLDVLKVNMQSKVLLPFGEVGLPSFLDMAFKEVVDLVSMSTLRGFTLIYWWAAIEVSFSFLVVLLLKCLPMWLSAHLKPSKSGFKHSHLMLRAWLMAFQRYIHQKAFTVSMVMFSTFEHSVHFLYHNVFQRRRDDCSTAQQLGITCLAGYAAGSIGSFISNPADNIVASLYNKKADTLVLAVKKIGLANLFTRSLPIRIMLVGPVVTLQWLFYDSIKVLSGLPTSGEVSMDENVDGASSADKMED